MATLYSLNLTADLTIDSTGYFNAYSNNLMSRCWVQQNASGSWVACNSGNNNSDDWGPTLVFSRGTSGNCDEVQFQVYYVNLQNGWKINSCNIYVSFAMQGRTNAANQTASPFTYGSQNARCLLAGTATSNGNTANPGYLIGPYTVGINPSAVTGNPTLNFEFSIVCSFELQQTGTNPLTQVYEFGYDPEMDLSVET